MLLSAVAIVALAAYDLLFVLEWHIGEWYTPVSVLFVSLLVVQLGETAAQKWPPLTRATFGWGLFLALGAVGLASFFELQRVLPWGRENANFCLRQAPRVIEYYAGAPPRLISRDDGMIAFCTGFPTTSGTRLALDAEAADASTAGGFEELLAKRGVDRLSALYYARATGFRVGERSQRVQAFAEGVLMAPPARTYEVEYVDRQFGILRARSPVLSE
jgi:hypothetical protein